MDASTEGIRTIKHFIWHTFEELLEFFTGVTIGAVGHYFVSDTGADGKKKFSINLRNFRLDAPHFAKTVEDVAEFNALCLKLQPGQMKQLEPWMVILGNHQRSHIEINIAEMTRRQNLSPDATTNNTLARQEAFTALEQLARVDAATDPANPNQPHPDPVERWRARNAHAVAFKLMRANENDYPGARWPAEIGQVLHEFLVEFQAAKMTWDQWMTQLTSTIDADTNRLEQARIAREQVRAQGGLRGAWNRFNQSRRRLSAFPWE